MLAPIQTTGLISKIIEQGALVAFMLFVLIVLCIVIKALYKNNVDLGKENTKALIDSTIAINNNTIALQLLKEKIGAK